MRRRGFRKIAEQRRRPGLHQGVDHGDLLVVGARLPERYLLQLSWDNEPIWRRSMQAHHDARPAPDGRFVTLTMGDRQIPSIDPSVPVRDNSVTFVDAGSNIMAMTFDED